MPLFLVASLPDDPPLASILEFCDKQCLKNVSFVEEVLFGDKLEHFKKRLAQDAITLNPSNVKQEVEETEPMVLGYDNDTSTVSCVTSREVDLARARQPTPPADPSIEYAIVVREDVRRGNHNLLKKAADPLAKNITCQICSSVTRCRTVVPNRLVLHAMTHVKGDKRRYHCNTCNMQADGVEERNSHSKTCDGKLLDRTMNDMDYLHEIRRLFGVCYPGLPIPFQQRAEWLLQRKADAGDKNEEKYEEKQFDDEKEKGSSEGPNEDGNGEEKDEETGEPAAKRAARECTPPVTPSSSYSIVPVRRIRKSIYYQKRPWVGTTCQVCFDVVAGYKPQRDNLMQHAVDHLDERLPGRFKCTLCGYSTHKKFHKYRHERECGLCDDRSITDPLLVRETQRVFVTCFPDVSIPLKKRGVMDDDDEDDDKEEVDEAMRKVKEQLPSKNGKKKKGREQPFECQKCGVYGRVMPARHIMLHYGGLQGDRYECNKCGAKTNSWSSRSHHQQVCPKKSSMKDRVGKDAKLRRALRRLHEECFPSRDVPESLMGGDEEEELEQLIDDALEQANREGEGQESPEQGEGGEGESSLSCAECGTAVDADSGSIWAHVQESHHPALRQNTPIWWKQLWKETARCFPTFKMQGK